MKTKNICKALALAILMPALLLNTACNSDITNNENTDGKGFALPVTVNVSRQGDDPATKATYNASTKKLEFSTGDKLFVNGTHTTAGQFAGTLTWTSGGTFSGTITTQHEWTDTADALFTAATKINAYLLPAGYESTGFLTIIPWNSAEYDDEISTVNSNAFALTLAAGIEQLSLESANAYSSGFALTPVNAILNFTISGLTASTEVAVVFSDSHDTVDKKVTTDASGNAKFVVGVLGTGAYTNIQNCTLTVGGKSIALASGSKTLEKGKIYNISRTILSITNPVVGQVIGNDGKNYAYAHLPGGVTAVAMIAYVNGNNGLAIAMADENNGNYIMWDPAMAAAAAHAPKFSSGTWKIPSRTDWKNMFKKGSGYEQYLYNQLNSAIESAGGTPFPQKSYWTSTDGGDNTKYIMVFNDGTYVHDGSRQGKELKTICARSCLAF